MHFLNFNSRLSQYKKSHLCLFVHFSLPSQSFNENQAMVKLEMGDQTQSQSQYATKLRIFVRTVMLRLVRIKSVLYAMFFNVKLNRSY